VRLLLASVIGFSAMSMVLLGTWQSSIPFISPADLGPSLEGKRVQVEGIVRALEPLGGNLSFELTDSGNATVAVSYRYRDGRPLALDEGRLAIAKGIYRGGLIEAQQVSIRAHEGIEP
jgi:cytochrome c-type biogenesis protein CcmE